MKRIMAGILALAAVLTAACGRAGDEDGSAFAPPEDRRLVIYTSHKEEVYGPLIREFEQRTGIWVELETGGTTQLLEKISQGNTDCDLMLGGGADSLSAYARCFSPYYSIYNESIEPRYRSTDGSYSPFSALPVVLIYNTKLVRMNPPTGFASLLDPAWRGKIAFADPAVSGSSFTSLVTMACALGEDTEATIREFAYSLEGNELSGSGDVLTAVNNGSFWVGVTLEETALKRQEAGDSINLVYPKEGTSLVPDGSALVKEAPHGDNAKRFLDFTVSYDVQEMMAGQYRRSVRGDVACLSQLPALEELTLVDYDIPWASQNHDAVLMTWAFYLDGEEET